MFVEPRHCVMVGDGRVNFVLRLPRKDCANSFLPVYKFIYMDEDSRQKRVPSNNYVDLNLEQCKTLLRLSTREVIISRFEQSHGELLVMVGAQ
jgi:hypothetical protein